MDIARTKSVPSPDERSLLDCALLNESLKPFEGWCSRGAMVSTSNLPKGMIVLTEQGLVFLADGTRGSIDKKGMMAYMAIRSVGNIIPFGGMIVAGALAGMNMFKNKDAEMEKRKAHPDSLWIPFVDIVSVNYEETRGFLSKTGYVRVRRQTAAGNGLDFFFTPGTQDIADVIFIQRFSIEKEYLINKYLDEAAGYSAFVAAKRDEMARRYGSQWEVLHMDEYKTACSRHLDVELAAKNMTYDSINDQIRRDLDHFRCLAQIAAFFK